MTVYVRGIGLIPIRDHWDLSISDLAEKAAKMALEDANLKDVDYIVVSNMSSQHLNMAGNLALPVKDRLGLNAKPITTESACGSGGIGINIGYRLIKSGAKNILVIGVEKLTDKVTEEVTTSMMMAEDRFFTGISGSSFISLNALALRHYLNRFQVEHEDIMLLPVLDHKNASTAKHAQFRYEITLDKVKKSPLVADPLHLLECSGTGDGAAALILSSEKGDVKILSSQIATDTFRISEREDPLVLNGTVKAARDAYVYSGISPGDVNIIEIHDAFSITGILSLEDLGFAEKGEGVKLLKDGKLELNGDLPANTFGGLKARGHPVGATGVYQVAEITLQLRGEAGKNQVENAKIGLAQNIGAIASSTAVTILSKNS